MEELAQVYANALFEVADENGVIDDVREQLGQFAEELDQIVRVVRTERRAHAPR